MADSVQLPHLCLFKVTTLNGVAYLSAVYTRPKKQLIVSQVNNTTSGPDAGIAGLNVITNLTPQYITMTNGALYCEGSSDGWIRLQSGLNGGTLTVDDTTFATSLGASRTFFRSEGWSSGKLVLNNTILHTKSLWSVHRGSHGDNIYR